MQYFELRKIVFLKAVSLQSFTSQELIESVQHLDVERSRLLKVVDDLMESGLFSRTYDRYDYIHKQ